LGTIMKMIYYHGIKFEEILVLKIGDVVSRGKIIKRFNLNNPLDFILMNDYKMLVQCHLDYLNKSYYSLKKDAPLFPKLRSTCKKNESSPYHGRGLRRDLEKYAAITWQQLWRDGIYHHYQLLSWRGYSNQDIIVFLAWFFRTERKKIYTILKKGGIMLSGVSLASVSEPPKAEPTPVKAIPLLRRRRRRPRRTERRNTFEKINMVYNEMLEEAEREEDYDREEIDDELTELSRYYWGDDFWDNYDD